MTDLRVLAIALAVAVPGSVALALALEAYLEKRREKFLLEVLDRFLSRSYPEYAVHKALNADVPQDDDAGPAQDAAMDDAAWDRFKKDHPEVAEAVPVPAFE